MDGDGDFLNGDAKVFAGDDEFAVEAEAGAFDVGEDGGGGAGGKPFEAGLGVSLADAQERFGDGRKDEGLDFAFAEVGLEVAGGDDFGLGVGAGGDDNIAAGLELLGDGLDLVEAVGQVDIGEDAIVSLGLHEAQAKGVAFAAVAGVADGADG